MSVFLATLNKQQRKESGHMANWSMVTAHHYKKAISHPGPEQPLGADMILGEPPRFLQNFCQRIYLVLLVFSFRAQI